jgi:protein TonB
MIRPFNPTYPPLARQAGISGDVELKLEIRKDGSVQSATVVSGHPMLTQGRARQCSAIPF